MKLDVTTPCRTCKKTLFLSDMINPSYVLRCPSCLEEVNNPLKDYNKLKALNKLEKALDYDPLNAPNVVIGQITGPGVNLKEMSRV